MLFTYGLSLTGKSHIERNIECQDAHRIKELENGWVIAAVADGVGSAKNSAIGSKIAVDSVVDVCEKFMPFNYDEVSIKSLILTAYNYAYKAIVNQSEKDNNSIESYDTTLSMVVFDGSKIYYGHSGDGAIIGLSVYGDYFSVTRTQKGADQVSVIPLRGGPSTWIIDKCEEDLSSVLLVTDGVLDALAPYLLREESPNLYVPLATFFMDPRCFEYSDLNNDNIRMIFSKSIEMKLDIEMYYKHIYDALKKMKYDEIDIKKTLDELQDNNYSKILIDSITDDVTILGIINSEKLPEIKPIEFFAEPKWNELQEDWNRKAYPHLYNSEKLNIIENQVTSDINEIEPEGKLQSQEWEVDKVNNTSKSSNGDVNRENDEPHKLKPYEGIRKMFGKR